MTGAIVISWGPPVRGREGKGLDVFGRAVEYFDDLAKAGRIHGHREFFSIQGVNGFLIVEGDLAELLKIQAEDATLQLLMAAGAVVEDFELCVYEGGSEASLREGITRYAATLDDLGYL